MKRVLVIRLSHLGDIILTEPVIRSVSAVYPLAEIDFVTRSMYSDVVSLFEGIARVITLQIPGKDQSLVELSRTLTRMCVGRYDLVIDLHNNLRSRWMRLRIDSGRARVYPKNWWARWRAVRRNLHTLGTHTVDLYLASLRGTGISPAARMPTLRIPGGPVHNTADGSHSLSDDYCVFAVGASHPTKHYPIPQWVELATAVNAEWGWRVIVVEKEHLGYLNLFEETQNSAVEIKTGLKLPTLARLLSGSRFTVSNDSGVMHLSAAVGTPTIGLFGPTHPSLGFSPLGNRCRAVTTNESCSPCSRHGESLCHRKDRYCFTKMDSDLIMRYIREVLDIAS